MKTLTNLAIGILTANAAKESCFSYTQKATESGNYVDFKSDLQTLYSDRVTEDFQLSKISVCSSSANHLQSIRFFVGKPVAGENYFTDEVSLSKYGKTDLPSTCRYVQISPTDYIEKVLVSKLDDN